MYIYISNSCDNSPHLWKRTSATSFQLFSNLHGFHHTSRLDLFQSVRDTLISNIHRPANTLAPTRSPYTLTCRHVLTDATLTYICRAICRRPHYPKYIGQYVCNPTVPVYIGRSICICSPMTPLYIGRAIHVKAKGTNTCFVGNIPQYSSMIDKYILGTSCIVQGMIILVY